MSDEDDILAIVAALKFLTSRDEMPPPKSRWKESGDAWRGNSWPHGDWRHGELVDPRPSLSRPRAKT